MGDEDAPCKEKTSAHIPYLQYIYDNKDRHHYFADQVFFKHNLVQERLMQKQQQLSRYLYLDR